MADIRPALLRDRLGDRPCRLTCRLPPPALLFPRSSYEGQISSSPHRHRPRRRVLRQCLRRRIRPLRCLADGYLQTVAEHAALAGRAGPAARRSDDAGREDRRWCTAPGIRCRSTPGFAGAVPANTRLGIPALYLADSPVGVGNGSTGVTQWADTSALASTWDTSPGAGVRQRLRRRAGRQGPQRRARRRRSTSCGCRSGAARPETFSEDPYLTGAAGGRGDPRRPEPARHRHREALRRQQPGGAAQPHQRGREPSARCSEIYQPAFKMAVQQGRRRRDHVLLQPGQRHLRLRERRRADRHPARRLEVRRPRHVRLGRAAQHRQGRAVRPGPGDARRAPTRPTPAPIDKIFGGQYFDSKLKAAVLDGSVPESTLDAHGHAHPHRDVPDRAVRPPDCPTPPPSRTRVVSTPAHQALSTKIADRRHRPAQERRRSLLPLSQRSARSIAVIGDAARSTRRPPPAARPPCCRPARSSPRSPASPPAPAAASTSPTPGARSGTDAAARGPGQRLRQRAHRDLLRQRRPLRHADRHRDRAEPRHHRQPRRRSAGHTVWSARYTGTITAPADRRLPLLASGRRATSRVWIDGRPVVSLHARSTSPPRTG